MVILFFFKAVFRKSPSSHLLVAVHQRIIPLVFAGKSVLWAPLIDSQKLNDWAREDSNLRPMDYESTALTTELRALCSLLTANNFTGKTA